MNTNPRREIEGRMTIARCMTLLALEKEIGKERTTVIASGKIDRGDELTPRIESNAGTYTVSLDDKCRILSNGQKMNIKINEKDREMQLARITEQQEASLDNDDIEK